MLLLTLSNPEDFAKVQQFINDMQAGWKEELRKEIMQELGIKQQPITVTDLPVIPVDGASGDSVGVDD